MLPRLALTFSLAIVLSAAPSRAQAQLPPEAQTQPAPQFDAPAYIAVIDGSVTLEREGRVERSPLNMPLLSGDRIRTTDGRVEIRFADGGRLLVDAGTAIDVLADDLVKLAEGRIRISVVRAMTQQVSYRVDSPAASVRIFQPGEYRVSLLRGAATSPGVGGEETQLEFAVTSGGGEISTAQGATPVRAGQRAYASAGLLPSLAYAYNPVAGDEFDHWADTQQDTGYQASSGSAEYLPQDMTSYAPTFDQYGDWRYQQSYGYVWYPRVAADWRPYYYGRWASYPSYGWTWIAGDPFGYPTHHYGRWGFNAGLWFWIPSAAWGPAYVSWAYAPDYVSWCPLGWNNSAVFSVGYYNVGSAYYSSHYHGHYYSAWTTVPHAAFGHGAAHQHAVNFDHGYGGARPHFSEGRSPVQPSFASARATTAAPIHNAGTRAAAPRYVNRGNEIVRSQTARPIAPRPPTGAPGGPNAVGGGRDTAVPRTAPAQNPSGVSAQRPTRAWDNPSYRPPNYNPAPARTAPSYSGPAYNTPSYNAPSYGAPRSYAPGYNRPSAPAPPARAADPAMRQPDAQRPQPRPEQGYSREQGAGSPRPAAPGGGGGERATPRSSGGSGGHVETHPPAAAGVAHSRGRSR